MHLPGKTMVAILKLIRFRNLLIIAATQYMMKYLIVIPILGLDGFEPQLDHLHFFLLVFSFMCIAAAGYVINDYFDTKTDLLNRPETVIVGRKITRRGAMTTHIILNSLGILAGIYLSWHIGIISLGVIYILAAGLLWFYSTTYKRQFLIGNLIVSLLTAIVPFAVVVYEIPALNRVYREVLIANNMNFDVILGWVGGFAFFAFLTTFLREVIKDIEDFEGDAAYGRNTLPIILGIRATKSIAVALILIIIAALVIVYIHYLRYSPSGGTDMLSLAWFAAGLVIPLFFLLCRILKARTRDDYHGCSNLNKTIMLAGILYSFIVYIIIQQNTG